LICYACNRFYGCLILFFRFLKTQQTPNWYFGSTNSKNKSQANIKTFIFNIFKYIYFIFFSGFFHLLLVEWFIISTIRIPAGTT